MLNKIEDLIYYNNSITKLLPYIVGKKKIIEDVQISEPMSINTKEGLDINDVCTEIN